MCFVSYFCKLSVRFILRSLDNKNEKNVVLAGQQDGKKRETKDPLGRGKKCSLHS